MRSFTILVPAMALLALTACQTSSLTEDQQEPLQESSQAFSGTEKQIDQDKSVISFMGNSNVIDHEGKFNDYDVTLDLDDQEPSNLEKAVIRAEINIASAETDAPGLDGHLKRADFFDAEQFPMATFVSTSIVNTGGNTYDVTGDITVKGMTKTVMLKADITDEYLTATYDLPRKDFGIGNDNYGDKLLEETVPVTIKLVFQQ